MKECSINDNNQVFNIFKTEQSDRIDIITESFKPNNEDLKERQINQKNYSPGVNNEFEIFNVKLN